jgi:ribose transport system substrate-binding protein
MNRNKAYLAVLISAILIVIFYASYGMMNIGRQEQYYTVSVIVDNSSGDRWNAFKEGLNQGAEDCRIYLNVVSTSEFTSLKEECAIINRELENGSDGVIVEAYESDAAGGMFADALSDKPVVLVENGLSYDIYSLVTPDHDKLGSAIAAAVTDGESSSLEGLRIGILSGNQNKQSVMRSLSGFQEGLEGTGAEILWCIQGEPDVESTLLSQYMEKNPVDVLATLGNDETEAAVDYLLEHPDINCRIYGEGRSEKAVYYLDKGIIQTLIVPNEYYMGYQSMILIQKQLENQATPAGETEVDFLTVTKDRVYEDDVVQTLFPTIR